jgi:hypothetical protein
MSGSPSQIRLLVMVLVGWCALSAAPVVANSPALPAAFFVIAVGLVAAVTLRFSTVFGLLMAVLGTALFAVSMVLDPATAASRGTSGIGGAITRLDQLLPALVAAVSLVGVAVCASLASWEIDGRPGAIQEAVVRRGSGAEQDDHGDAYAPAQPAGEPHTFEPAARETAVAEHAEGRHAAEAPDGAREAAAVPGPPTGPGEPAEPAEPAAAGKAQDQPPGEEIAGRPAAEEVAGRPAAEEIAGRPAAEEAAAEETAAAASPRNGEPASDEEHPPVEQTPAITEPAPAAEPAQAAGHAAQPGQAERPQGAAAAAPAETASQAGDVKGEEIAARDHEDRNGSAEGDQRQALGPDWRHRRRPDDDAARRIPRRRKR